MGPAVEMSSLSDVQALSPSEAVVERIAAIEDADPTELVPLYEAIDPDALNSLVETTEQSASALRLEFSYHGHRVTVTGRGEVHIDEAVDSPAAIA